MQDFSRKIQSLSSRLDEARQYLRIDFLRSRRPQLEAELGRPDLWDDAASAQAIQREFAELEDDLNLFDDLAERIDDVSTLSELVRDENDESLEPEVEAEIVALETEFSELELRSLFTGEYDDRDAIVEVNSGAGGVDSQDWAEMILRMYQRWAEDKNFDVQLESATDGGEAGISSATVVIHGRYAYGMMRAEHGVHRLVRISPFDSNARRHTSFASVKVTPFLDDVDEEIDIDDKELRIDVYRSSGAGGQHVNVTDSAVRITHLPTGIVTSCQNERSQHQNKDRAMKILKAKLLELEREKRAAELDAITGNQSAVDFGSQDRNYVLHPYQQVKDLRSGLELSNPQAVLDGELDGLMEAFLRWEREHRSQASA